MAIDEESCIVEAKINAEDIKSLIQVTAKIAQQVDDHVVECTKEKSRMWKVIFWMNSTVVGVLLAISGSLLWYYLTYLSFPSGGQ